MDAVDETTGNSSFKRLYWLVPVCMLPLGVSPLLHYLAVAQNGSESFLWIELFLAVPFLAALLTLLVAPFLLTNPQYRPVALRSLILAAILALATLGGARLGARIRMTAFKDLALRSAPLVKAIRTYESKFGTPPQVLSALVPEYLPAIPGTGMAAYPNYEYQVGEQASQYEGNPWALVVLTPSGGINFDQFIYLPLQNYPATGYGGMVERIADWAYVHE